MLGTWAKDASGLTAEFTAGQPFPLLVLDDFLEESFAGELVAEFPGIHSMDRSKDYMFGDKREKAAFGGAGPASQRYQDLLLSGEFAGILAEIVGRTLFMDPAFHGGGFHQGGDGSFLDTHVDFNIHPDHKDWLRVLNVLLYLNKDWPAEYGGDLLLRTGPKEEPRAIAPLFNRGVLMLTSGNTYHGYRKMTLPPGATRKSIAGYAYELIPEGSLQARTTSWAPEEAGILKRALARNWTRLSAAKNRLGGKKIG